MGRYPDFFLLAGILALGILIGILSYQSLFQPKIIERAYFEEANGTVTVTTRPLSFTDIYNSKIPVLAVRSDDNAGILSFANIEIRSGKGRVLINTNPFVEPDTQYSAETAVTIAEKITGADMRERDVILTFEANTSLVGGPSAGAAITIAAIAAIEKEKLPGNIAITGTIEEDGSIGQVGGVLEKAQAASQSGITLFLVPEGSLNLVYYEKQVNERRIGPFVVQEVNYVPKKLDLAEYAMDKWKLEVKEVRNISEARAYFGV
ncbi:MAG: S16 family serine protease [Candidatus Micrarchaeota archaeon]